MSDKTGFNGLIAKLDFYSNEFNNFFTISANDNFLMSDIIAYRKVFMSIDMERENQVRTIAREVAKKLMDNPEIFQALNEQIQTRYGAKYETPDSLVNMVWGYVLQHPQFDAAHPDQFMQLITAVESRSQYIEEMYQYFYTITSYTV